MAKPNFIELPGCEPVSIIFEDRSVLAIDSSIRAQGLPEPPKTEWRKQ